MWGYRWSSEAQLQAGWVMGLRAGTFDLIDRGGVAMSTLTMRPLESSRVTSGGCLFFRVPEGSGFEAVMVNSVGRCYGYPDLLGKPPF